jgi:hypothetical protein
LGFHPGFLDDDDTQTDGVRVYHDDPEGTGRLHGKEPNPSPSGSGGSWEHA